MTGNTVDDDACSNSCVSASCGDHRRCERLRLAAICANATRRCEDDEAALGRALARRSLDRLGPTTPAPAGPTPSEPAQQPKGANSESIVVVMVATRGSSKAASLSKAEGKKKMVVEKTIEKQPTAETIVVESSQCIDLKTGDEHCHSGVIRYHPPKPTLRPALTWGATMDAAHLVLARTGAKSSWQALYARSARWTTA